MSGMRQQPRDLHREVLRRDASQWSDDPSWYAVWLGQPHGDGSALLGRTERLPRPRHWRAFPVGGEYPRVFGSWTAAAAWLLEVHAGRDKVLDYGRAVDLERVG